MKTRDGTTPLRRWHVTLVVIALVACGSIRLAAQTPPVPPPADTTGSLSARAATDTVASTSTLAGDDAEK
jgi:hypothetical protein